MDEENKVFVSTGTASKALGVCPNTLRLWDKNGKIECIRTPGNERLYNIKKFAEIQAKRTEEERDKLREEQYKKEKRIDVIYTRVSGSKQKEDLERQTKDLLELYPGFQVLSDIGSGLNFERKNFKKLLRLVMQRKIGSIVVSYKDRLCRFAFELIRFICEENQTKLLVHFIDKEGSPESELMEDLMAVVHVFSSRLYGKRGNKKRKRLSVLSNEQSEVKVGENASENINSEEEEF
jgi:predicted site-specific integrase-resolvase